MAPDAFRAVAGHESNDYTTDDGYKDYRCAEMVASRRYQARSPALEEEKICEQTDESQ